jgi:hypothetical protein
VDAAALGARAGAGRVLSPVSPLAARRTNDVVADGEVVWSCSPAIFSVRQKRKNALLDKDFCNFSSGGNGACPMSQAPIGPSFKPRAKVGVDVRFSPNSGANADMLAGPSCAQHATFEMNEAAN